MIKRPLSAEEAALWAKVAGTVTPIRGRRIAVVRPAEADADTKPRTGPPPPPAKRRAAPGATPPPAAAKPSPVAAEPPRPLDRHGLDNSWERKLARGVLQPEFTLDLHGATLDSAYSRLEHGLSLAMAQGARVVLLITGRPRPADGQAGRGDRRGAIRAKFVDWLTAGPHASRIAAIRPAHPRHGGSGAVYIVLRRPR